jgi:hypothetical protein
MFFGKGTSSTTQASFHGYQERSFITAVKKGKKQLTPKYD